MVLHIFYKSNRNIAEKRYALPSPRMLRAFINGRFDLSQAEAVAGFNCRRCESSNRSAITQMQRGFSEEKNYEKNLFIFASLIEQN